MPHMFGTPLHLLTRSNPRLLAPAPPFPPRLLGRNQVLGRQTLVLGAETYLEREEPG